ncbi:MAG TPA: glutaminase [Burkholderiales bacterium]|nr:glutaminase [Burkholderiales bacterium]
MDYQTILDRVHTAVKPIIGSGKVASYIPELAKVPPDQFGIAIVDLDGKVYQAGAADTPFSIQSISKLFGLTLAFYQEGDSIWSRVGREPSGTPFNSLVQLEQERGKPRNPFINAGALVITDMLLTHFADEGGAGNALIKFIRKLANKPDIGFNRAVADSEQGTSHRNAAMAHFMKSFGNLNNSVNDVIEAYCRDCAIEMSCIDLARSVTFLANHGVVPWSSEKILDASSAKRINALMLTCGTYDAAGDFAFRVGLPAKSGVGGGIVALMPGECGICVWSPALEESGNSYAGSVALEMLTSMSGRSVF